MTPYHARLASTARLLHDDYTDLVDFFDAQSHTLFGRRVHFSVSQGVGGECCVGAGVLSHTVTAWVSLADGQAGRGALICHLLNRLYTQIIDSLEPKP